MGSTVADIMAGETHREKLDQLNELVTDRLLQRIEGKEIGPDGEPVPLSNDDLRVIQQQLKNNSISAAAMPDNPMDRMKQMLQGMRISPGHLEARQKALPHLLPITANATDCAATAKSSEW